MGSYSTIEPDSFDNWYEDLNLETSYLERLLEFISLIYVDLHKSLQDRLKTPVHGRPLAFYVGQMLMIIFYVTRLFQDIWLAQQGSRQPRYSDYFDLTRSAKLKEFDFLESYANLKVIRYINQEESWGDMISRYTKRLVSSTAILLILINILISWRLFHHCFKIYGLYYTNGINEEDSPSLNLQSIDSIGKNEDQLSKGPMSKFLRFLLNSRNNTNNNHNLTTKEDSNNEYLTLKKWVPSTHLVALMTGFSPTGVVFISMLDTSFYTLFPLIIHQYLIYYIIWRLYETRTKDEQILLSALQQEIQLKTYRSPLYQDAMTDTSDPYGGYVEFFPSISTIRTPVFKTHDIRGNTISESYDSGRRCFDINPLVDLKTQQRKNLIVYPDYNSIKMHGSLRNK